MSINIAAFARGLATYLPGVDVLQRRVTRTGGSDSARYCYTVWLRHLVMGHRNSLCGRTPLRVAELGPGDSIGIGLAALLSGAERYYGLDALPLATLSRNTDVFAELVELFRSHAPIPDEREFPYVRPQLDSYAFPRSLVDDPDQERVNRIRSSLAEPARPDSMIRYVAPWWDPDVIEPAAVDMIFSQAVLEHVEHLEQAYAAMRCWLMPGGWMSHQVDFRSHGTTTEWNGHWACAETTWRLLKGRRAFLINREPHSTHLRLLRQNGFSIVCDQTVSGVPLSRHRLTRRFAELSDADLATSGAFIQARVA